MEVRIYYQDSDPEAENKKMYWLTKDKYWEETKNTAEVFSIRKEAETALEQYKADVMADWVDDIRLMVENSHEYEPGKRAIKIV